MVPDVDWRGFVDGGLNQQQIAAPRACKANAYSPVISEVNLFSIGSREAHCQTTASYLSVVDQTDCKHFMTPTAN